MSLYYVTNAPHPQTRMGYPQISLYRSEFCSYRDGFHRSSNIGFPPEAVGNVTNFILVSPNILTPTSLINLNLLSSEFDVFALREGVKAVQRLLATTPFQGFILQSTTNATTDEEIDQFVRETIIAGLHPVGSAAMSQKGVDWGVVDPDLKLKGARGVRVVDASVLVRRRFGIFLESEN
ncbi:hypothetical protein D9758_004721 [Tetrapyrgos nigripes]|uniref:Glucose-methanol-choline oxidoreductase C-terminal domain-containing protein n=1 Tax=Tetrapyrgos nigripes TaxID=182062 RepID=A0A8H5LYJ3_9AGAR|nr:hypothetical protein D9758_004721 [Tetrapyrgos nigripes]